MLWFNWGMASALGVILIIVVAIVGIIGLALFRHYDIAL
jgi:ABC-type spermidine/putrescine transport system permease subunit I